MMYTLHKEVYTVFKVLRRSAVVIYLSPVIRLKNFRAL